MNRSWCLDFGKFCVLPHRSIPHIDRQAKNSHKCSKNREPEILHKDSLIPAENRTLSQSSIDRVPWMDTTSQVPASFHLCLLSLRTPHHQLFSLVSLCLPFPGTVFTPHSRPQHPDMLCSAHRLPARLCPPCRRHQRCNPSKHASGSRVPDMLCRRILTSALRHTVTNTIWVKKLRHHNFQHFYRKSQRSK
ncbi:unnamed protein product [Gulo gulo]|uniref:Uncharacterized protein n=1 Tax=Gulo gulo TaxID=48420 RepID=A0A9X9LHS9_GULGU|nr:unnamed protein product [Gulo gulo]